MAKKTCTVYRRACTVHGFHHGAEAEELRKGIEEVIHGRLGPMVNELMRLLDRVDARDSLAYLEAQDSHRREPAPGEGE